MNPLARILAATDLSAPSRHAVDRGFRIAADSGAAYTVIHSLKFDALDEVIALLGGNAPQVKQRLEDEAREALHGLLLDDARNQGIAASARIVRGPTLRTITEEADALDANLLMVGARGESFLRHALLGATASRLLRKSIRRPVLIVKQQPHERYQRLLIPVDFSPASQQAIRLGRALAPLADIILLHAFELPYEGKLYYAGVHEATIKRYITAEQEKRSKHLCELAERAGLGPAEYTAVVLHGDPMLQIIAQEQEQNCDLIVMGKNGAFMEDLLLGSVTQHVLETSQNDVLVIPDKRPPESPNAGA